LRPGEGPDREYQRLQVIAIQVKVRPRARISLLTQQQGGVWLAHLKSPPLDGKANEELVALVARHFGCRRSAVSIKSGASSRTKLVLVAAGHGQAQNVS
jgi:uncharacterized protein YggU (UPF0235/DUF167 family)